MFGRLKLALVALVLMPATAFAADHSPRHSPGQSVVSQHGETKVAAVPATRATAQKHRAVKAAPVAGPSTIELFLASLGDEPSSFGKQAAAAVSPDPAPDRNEMHRPG